MLEVDNKYKYAGGEDDLYAVKDKEGEPYIQIDENSGLKFKFYFFDENGQPNSAKNIITGMRAVNNSFLKQKSSDEEQNVEYVVSKNGQVFVKEVVTTKIDDKDQNECSIYSLNLNDTVAIWNDKDGKYELKSYIKNDMSNQKTYNHYTMFKNMVQNLEFFDATTRQYKKIPDTNNGSVIKLDENGGVYIDLQNVRFKVNSTDKEKENITVISGGKVYLVYKNGTTKTETDTEKIINNLKTKYSQLKNLRIEEKNDGEITYTYEDGGRNNIYL